MRTMIRSMQSKMRAGAILAVLALAAGAGNVAASELEGRWSGGGSFSLPTGANEKARCNVSYSKAGASAYTAFATCATPSMRVTQSAKLRRVAGNQYEGSFFNAEHNVTGSISITVSGASQSIYMSGGGAQASFRLSKR